MGKEIGRSFNFNRSKLSNPTLKKPVLSSLSAHTSFASNSTQTSISYQLDNTPIKNRTIRAIVLEDFGQVSLDVGKLQHFELVSVG